MRLDFVKKGAATMQASRAADFFRMYPRIQFGNTDLKLFSLSSDYLTAIKFQALPYLLVGVLLVLGAVVFNTYRYFRRGLSPGADDTKDSDPGKRDSTAKAYVLFSAFLHVCILLLIGIAAFANTTVRQSVYISHLSIQSLRDDIDIRLVKPATFFAEWASKVEKIPKGDRAEGPKQTAFALLTVNLKAFLRTQKASEASYQQLQDMDNYLNSTSLGMYYGITAILLVFIAGCFLMYFSDVAPPRAHKVRMLMIVFFAVPLGASWGLLGFSTVVGQAAGDFCYALKAYHDSVAWTASALPLQRQFFVAPDNMFIKSDLQCPTATKFSNDMRKLTIFYNISKSDEFLTGVSEFDRRRNSKEHWKRAVKWALDGMEDYQKCTAHMRFGGTLSFNMCGDHNHSAVSAMAVLWLSSAGLSMLFGVLVFISSLGQPPAEFATAYEMLQMFGAPKLIRAFGEVAETGGFMYMSPTMARESMQSRDTNQGTLHVTKSVAEAFTDCAIQVEDNYMVRISTNPLSRKRSTSILRSTFSRRNSAQPEDDGVKKPKSREKSTNSQGRWFLRRRSSDAGGPRGQNVDDIVEVEERTAGASSSNPTPAPIPTPVQHDIDAVQPVEEARPVKRRTGPVEDEKPEARVEKKDSSGSFPRRSSPDRPAEDSKPDPKRWV